MSENQCIVCGFPVNNQALYCGTGCKITREIIERREKLYKSFNDPMSVAITEVLEEENKLKCEKSDNIETGGKENDAINHPAHYLVGGIETLDYIKAKLSGEEYRGYLKGCIIKYLSRANYKGKPLEDHRKAKFYLDELVKITEENAK